MPDLLTYAEEKAGDEDEADVYEAEEAPEEEGADAEEEPEETGEGYGRIAAQLQISINTVKSFCRRHSLAASTAGAVCEQ